jgi:hypothetical protein
MLKFTVSRTFDTYTPPDDPDAEAIDGDTDNGFVFEDEIMEFRDVLRELQDMNELSCGSYGQTWEGTWATQEHQTSCYRTGETRAEAVHISHVNGKPITGHQLRRLLKAAGLIKPRDFNPSETRAYLIRCHNKEVLV